jgi:hypothetical protein
MGVIQQPPPEIQVAEARDELFRFMPAVQLAELKIISRALADPRYNKQAEHFKLTYYEATGYIAAAQATRKKAEIDKALSRAVKLIDEKILQNPAYDPFRVTVAVGDDPILGAVPRDMDGVGPGQ